MRRFDAGGHLPFKTLVDVFREHAGSIPSDIVSQRDAEQYSRMALGTSREAGIRVYGTGDRTLRWCHNLRKNIQSCGRRLRDAIPVSVPIIGLFVARRMLRNPLMISKTLADD
jgi:hypothetical protein